MEVPSACLGDICDVVIGRTPPRERREYWDGDYPWTSIADFNQGETIRRTKEKITSLAVEHCKCRLIPKDTILLSFKLSIGKVAVSGMPLYTNEAIAALPIRDRRQVATRYLVWALRSLNFGSQVDRAAMGLTLNRAKLLKVKVPLPSVSGQHRIAAILDQADALRTKRRTALALLDEMATAAFLAEFGDPVANPKGWKRVRVGDIANVVTGNTPPRANPAYYGPGVEWLKSDNLNGGSYYATPAEEHLSAAGRIVARTAPPRSILVTCIAGSPDSIGNAAMLDREAAFNQQINALVPKEGNPHFLYAQLRVGKALVQEASTGAMKGMVSKSRFEGISMIFPPAERQDAFARVALAIEAQRRVAERAARETDALFASVQHRAFRGEL